jgi:3'(2'), 5'-bisphosphate nucleotidase
MIKSANYLLSAITAALKAGEAILQVYRSDFEVEKKADNSPLTVADRRAHEIIKAQLLPHGLPLISEEGKHTPFANRSAWPVMWIVDPLDGTKEFIKRNGEFTVNIALVEGHRPVAGVVYAPVLEWLYFASIEFGAYKLTEARQRGNHAQSAQKMEPLLGLAQKLPLAQPPARLYTIVGSRSHGTPELEEFVETKRREKGQVNFVQAGSALKICLVAEGKADIYPRLGPTMEWDTAAGQAVAECAGATMHTYASDDPLRYNKENLLNPWFVVER